MKARRKLRRTPEGNANRRKARMAKLDALAALMYADYQGGLTLEEVGQKHGRPWTSVHALFRKRGLVRRQRQTPEQIARRAALRRAKLDPLVGDMYADYSRPMSLCAVGRKYGYDYRVVRELFVTRGLPVRVVCRTAARDPATGKILPYVPLTDEQLEALISRMQTLHLPAELRLEWRTWSLERRGWFVARLRAKLARPSDRPDRPFSGNVEPFDYASPRAHEIVRALNTGTNSRSARIKIDLCSQGVIWRDRLWFWSHKVGYQSGPWQRGRGRPVLHKTIWEEANGRTVPPGHVLRFIDGNPNNLVPENISLATRNAVLRETQATHLNKRSRELTSILLNRSQSENRHALSDRIIAASR